MTAPPKMTKAGLFANAAEKLGWTVERIKVEDRRTVVATRPDTAGKPCEYWRFTWRVPADGSRVTFVEGLRSYPGAPADPWFNVAYALRLMALPPMTVRADGRIVRLPFDPEIDDDATVLRAVAGREITWGNSLTNRSETATVPRGGIHLKLTCPEALDHPGARRVLTFCAAGSSWRSVRLSSIESVE